MLGGSLLPLSSLIQIKVTHPGGSSYTPSSGCFRCNLQTQVLHCRGLLSGNVCKAWGVGVELLSCSRASPLGLPRRETGVPQLPVKTSWLSWTEHTQPTQGVISPVPTAGLGLRLPWAEQDGSPRSHLQTPLPAETQKGFHFQCHSFSCMRIVLNPLFFTS